MDRVVYAETKGNDEFNGGSGFGGIFGFGNCCFDWNC